jgi:diadenosine tetraphosphate (Ap4A) HIT family hydrolase
VLSVGHEWTLVLNHNQNLLGKCMWVLRRHEESVVALTLDEWRALQLGIIQATTALQQVFQPNHYNYAFLQNQDRHVHMHIIPRYATERTLAGQTFLDPDYPGHYAVPGPVHRLDPTTLAEVAACIRQFLT